MSTSNDTVPKPTELFILDFELNNTRPHQFTSAIYLYHPEPYYQVVKATLVLMKKVGLGRSEE